MDRVLDPTYEINGFSSAYMAVIETHKLSNHLWDKCKTRISYNYKTHDFILHAANLRFKIQMLIASELVCKQRPILSCLASIFYKNIRI